MLWRLSLGIAGSQAEGGEEPAEVVQALEVVRVLAGSLHPALHPALQQLLPALPFVLRRVKEEVLADLPPKITQDYYCHLSPLQTEVYEDFTRAQGRVVQEGGQGPSPHVFQALQYFRKVCCHPKLVLAPDHPEYEAVLAEHLMGDIRGLVDIQHAVKLVALRQLLVDLGMGREDQVVGQHRALVFCQLKAMLDIVETDLLKVFMHAVLILSSPMPQAHLPKVSYLRLDGSVPAASRHAIVSKFNSDPSIDLLLLSTSVGGLGPNLTGADTVIFVKHDWNPMKDLQAMDRAHRIGQKKVVNVYRLITRATIEEKIMSLQKFKLHTARTVISSDNSAMASMQTEGVLDLFSLAGDAAAKPGAEKAG
jgi:TATA-binding protein-associated factor